MEKSNKKELSGSLEQCEATSNLSGRRQRSEILFLKNHNIGNIKKPNIKTRVKIPHTSFVGGRAEATFMKTFKSAVGPRYIQEGGFPNT